MTLGIFEALPRATELTEGNQADISIANDTSNTVSRVLDFPTITYPGEFPGETALRAWIIENNPHGTKLNESFHILFTDGVLYSTFVFEEPIMDIGEKRQTGVTFHRISPAQG